jgi:hypothetical protein
MKMVQIQVCTSSVSVEEMPEHIGKAMRGALKLALDHKLKPKKFVFNEQATPTDPYGEYLKIGVQGEEL